MDIEEAPQQPQIQHEMLQQQVDEAMFENNNNIVKYGNTNRQLENVESLSQQNHQQNHQHNEQHLVQTPQQPTQQQQTNVYHHQQHYQGHLHRANRDVSRCMLSHMI